MSDVLLLLRMINNNYNHPGVMMIGGGCTNEMVVRLIFFGEERCLITATGGMIARREWQVGMGASSWCWNMPSLLVLVLLSSIH